MTDKCQINFFYVKLEVKQKEFTPRVNRYGYISVICYSFFNVLI